MTELFTEKLTLPALVILAAQLPQTERHVCEVISGADFDEGDFSAGMFSARGLHHCIQRPDGEAVAAGGFLPQRDGVYRTWFCAPEWAWKVHGGELTRISGQAIQHMLDAGLAHRIETVTLASETRTRQWYEKIGLAYESTLRGYGSQGEDLVMYVALKKTERA